MGLVSSTATPETGRFYKKQLLSRSALVAFSHRSRFTTARRLVTPYAGSRLLDYGCGDGTFLSQVADLFPTAVGTDRSPVQIEGCTRRLGSLASLRFLHTSELAGDEHAGRFDLATCMETLEHCTEPALEEVLFNLRRLVKPGGILVISVPIETGPTLLLKQAARRVLGWRKVGEYEFTEPYTPLELLKMTFAGPATRIERPLYHGVEHPHKGFNWRRLDARLRQLFAVESLAFSPFSWSRGLASSQAWFICRNERVPAL